MSSRATGTSEDSVPDVAPASTDTEKRLAEAIAKLDSVRAQRDALRRRSAILQDQRDEARKKLGLMQDRVGTVRDALAKSRQREHLLDSRITKLQEKLAASKSVIEQLRQQRFDLRQRITGLRADVEGIKSFKSVVAKELSLAAGPIEAQRRAAFTALVQIQAEATLVRSLVRGIGFDESAVATIRKLLEGRSHIRARSFSQALLEHKGTANVGHLGVALVAIYQKLDDLALHHFLAVPNDFRIAHAPNEWLSIQFALDPDVAMRIILDRPLDLGKNQSLMLAAIRYAYREKRRDLGLQLLNQLRELLHSSEASLDLNAQDTRDYNWLIEWESKFADLPQATGEDVNTINIGVLDYKQPDFLRQSSNLGDYVQTIGSLGHLLSFSDAKFCGEKSVTASVDFLRHRMRPELLNDAEVKTTINLVRVNRDASQYDRIPQNTWLLSFGWFMHSSFGGSYDFPFHENVNPIFVSFHIQHRKMLTPAAIQYLKQHGPIGCRDWTTTYLLLSVGVDAFFSGCLTTTVDAFFSPSAETSSAGAGTAVVDAPVPADLLQGTDVVQLTQASEDVCRNDLEANIRTAVQLLDEYRTFERIITSRLHCYLPATAIGCDVDFTPRRLSDIRFDGLLGMKPGSSELKSIQVGLRSKLQDIYQVILSGAASDEVYTEWRRITNEEVKAAKSRLALPFVEEQPSFDVEAACARVRASQSRYNEQATSGKSDAINVALAADENLRDEAPVVIQSILRNTSRPVHFWFLSRGYDERSFVELATVFPEASFTFLPCDGIDYGPVPGMLKHITVSTMDRLLLPLLLQDVDRVVYHDIDAITVADIGELFDYDLNGCALAARSARASWAESGFGNVYRAANKLDHEVAFELRRRMHQTLHYDFTAFNAGILVMDLAKMRSDNFCKRFVPYAERYGMNDQDILNCYVGAERAILEPSWNNVPLQEVIADPKIIHWAGPAKPWKPEYVIHQKLWDQYAEMFSSRRQKAEFQKA